MPVGPSRGTVWISQTGSHPPHQPTNHNATQRFTARARRWSTRPWGGTWATAATAAGPRTSRAPATSAASAWTTTSARTAAVRFFLPLFVCLFVCLFVLFLALLCLALFALFASSRGRRKDNTQRNSYLIIASTHHMFEQTPEQSCPWRTTATASGAAAGPRRTTASTATPTPWCSSTPCRTTRRSSGGSRPFRRAGWVGGWLVGGERRERCMRLCGRKRDESTSQVKSQRAEKKSRKMHVDAAKQDAKTKEIRKSKETKRKHPMIPYESNQKRKGKWQQANLSEQLCRSSAWFFSFCHNGGSHRFWVWGGCQSVSQHARCCLFSLACFPFRFPSHLKIAPCWTRGRRFLAPFVPSLYTDMH